MMGQRRGGLLSWFLDVCWVVGPGVCQEMFVFLIVSAFVCGSELSVLNHRQFWDCLAERKLSEHASR